MGKFSLENIIKNRLKGHEVHVDKRELWKSLGIEEEEKDRKGIWLWWFAGLVGILFVGGLWWYTQTENFESPVVQDTTTLEIDEDIAKTGNETVSETSATEQLSSIIEEVKSLESNSSDIINQTSNYSSSSTISNTNSNGTPAIGNSLSENRVENKSILPLVTKAENNAENTPNINEVSNVDTKVTSNDRAQEMTIVLLPYLNTELYFDRELDALAVLSDPLTKPVIETRKFELELFGGIGTMTRTLETENRDLGNYIIGRDSSESLLEHISAGVSLKYILGGGFYGKAGLSLNRWNEKYFYNIVSDTVATQVEVPDIILIDLQGNMTTEYKEGTQISYNTTNWIRYNRLTQIDLPITLGYEQRINRWSLFGEATGIINLTQTFSGYLNNEEGNVIKNPEIFKSRIGINLGLNAGIGYGITPRLRARLSANYYRSLGSVLETSSDLDQRYTSFGLRMGLGFLF